MIVTIVERIRDEKLQSKINRGTKNYHQVKPINVNISQVKK